MKLHAWISFFFLYASANAQEYNLTITNGDGAGPYEKGEQVHVWADRPAPFEVFDSWTGFASTFLKNKNEWHTTLNIPAELEGNNFELIANFEELELLDQGTVIYDQFGERGNDGIFFPVEKTIHYAKPNFNNRGIIFLFHGTGGSGASWFSRFERISLVKDLVQAGFHVFSLDSNETTLGDQNADGAIRWEADMSKADVETNIDLLNVATSLEQLSVDEELEGFPVYLIGGSNGANFSDFCSASLNYEASAHITGNGNNAVFQDHENLKPILWLQAKNDNNQSADSLRALANYRSMLAQGICSRWIWHERSPLYPNRFARSYNNINEDLSKAIFDKLRSENYLDEENYLNVLHVNGEFPFNEFIEEFNLNNDQKRDVLDQLNAANADHGAFSDYNKSIIDFFDSCENLTSQQNINSDDNLLTIFPNPSCSFFELATEEFFDCLIYDQNGKLVLQIENANSIDLSSQTNGVYFAIIYSSNKTHLRKLIKK